MIDYFVKGGALMYPILACSLVSVAVIVERLIHYFLTRDDRPALRRLDSLALSGGLAAAPDALQQARGTTAEFCRSLLQSLKSGDRDAARTALQRKGDEILRRLGRGIHLLELVERLAPLFGFLGTVVGMVQAFARVASAEGPVKPALIADGIWQALITTVAGLLAAIPALIASHFFTAHLRTRAERMRAYGELLLATAEEDAHARLP